MATLQNHAGLSGSYQTLTPDRESSRASCEKRSVAGSYSHLSFLLSTFFLPPATLFAPPLLSYPLLFLPTTLLSETSYPEIIPLPLEFPILTSKFDPTLLCSIPSLLPWLSMTLWTWQPGFPIYVQPPRWTLMETYQLIMFVFILDTKCLYFFSVSKKNTKWRTLVYSIYVYSSPNRLNKMGVLPRTMCSLEFYFSSL